MKKKTLLLLFILYSFKGFGQLNSGNWLVDANGDLGLQITDFSATNFWKINPTIGFFIKDNVVLGSSFSYYRNKVKPNNNNGLERIEERLSPFIRYYIYGKRFFPFFEIEYDFHQMKFDGPNVINGKGNTKNLLLKLGFNWSFSPNIALETNFSYRLTNDNFEIDNQEHYYSVFGSGKTFLEIGLNYFLIQKKNRSKDSLSTNLKNRYLKKGNQFVGFSGFGSFKNFFIFGNIKWQQFLKNNLRLITITEIFLSENAFNSGRFGGLILPKFQIERFISISENAFFVPNFGVNLGVSFANEEDYFIGANIHPKLVYFRGKSLLEFGFFMRTPFKEISGGGNETDWEGSIIFATELFLQQNLSLRLEYRSGVFGQIFRRETIFTSDPLPEHYFNIGINYFFNNTKIVG